MYQISTCAFCSDRHVRRLWLIRFEGIEVGMQGQYRTFDLHEPRHILGNGIDAR